jgi:hypothetical protein
MPTTRIRKRPRKRAPRRRRARPGAGKVLRQIVRQRPRSQKTRGILTMRCRVASVVSEGEFVVFVEPVERLQFALPLPSKKRDGSSVRALNLKEGQDVWLSIGPT